MIPWRKSKTEWVSCFWTTSRMYLFLAMSHFFGVWEFLLKKGTLWSSAWACPEHKVARNLSMLRCGSPTTLLNHQCHAFRKLVVFGSYWKTVLLAKFWDSRSFENRKKGRRCKHFPCSSLRILPFDVTPRSFLI